MKKRIYKRSVVQQCRSCEFCRSVDGLEISSFQQEGDTVSCQVCGVQYRIQSLSPLRLYPVNSQKVQEQQGEVNSGHHYFRQLG